MKSDLPSNLKKPVFLKLLLTIVFNQDSEEVYPVTFFDNFEIIEIFKIMEAKRVVLLAWLFRDSKKKSFRLIVVTKPEKNKSEQDSTKRVSFHANVEGDREWCPKNFPLVEEFLFSTIWTAFLFSTNWIFHF